MHCDGLYPCETQHGRANLGRPAHGHRVGFSVETDSNAGDIAQFALGIIGVDESGRDLEGFLIADRGIGANRQSGRIQGLGQAAAGIHRRAEINRTAGEQRHGHQCQGENHCDIAPPIAREFCDYSRKTGEEHVRLPSSIR